MKIKLFDSILLKDGREADVMEILSNTAFIVDVGDSPNNWETIDITIDDIEKVIQTSTD